MRSPTPVLAASLPTRLSTNLSFQPSRPRPAPSSSIPSLARFPRLLLRNSSNTPLTTSRSPPDENFAMAGPIRTNHARAEGHNPMGQQSTAQPSAQASGSNATQGEKRTPRPSNPWILYRKDKLASLMNEHPENKKLPQAELSKMISTLWKNETAEVRQYYELQADIAKEQHQKEFPEYQFRPMKKADKERLREEKRLEKEREREAKQRAKQLQQQVRDGQASQNPPHAQMAPVPLVLPPGTPLQSVVPTAPGTAPVVPSAQQAANNNQVHQLAVMRFGFTGPSPPVSECPSPFGSPLMPLMDEDGSGSSRSSSLSLPQNGRASATPTPTTGAHDASFTSTSLAAPQASTPLRPPSASAFNIPDPTAPNPFIQDGINPPQDALPPWAQSNQLPEASGSVDPAHFDDQGAGLMEWIDPSFMSVEQNEMYGFDALSNTNLNMSFTNGGELSFGNTSDTATHALIEQTINPDIFALSIPTASFDNPPGEIQVSTSNQYAGSTNAFGASEGGDSMNFDIQSLLAEYGLESLTSGIFTQEQGDLSGVQVEGAEPAPDLVQLVEGLVEMNAKAQESAAADAMGDFSLNMQTDFGMANGPGLGDFIAPSSLSVGALPSPPESSSAGSQAAQSPYAMMQPTNLGASGSGSQQGQVQMSHYRHVYAQGPAAGGEQFGETTHPTPPSSAGPTAPSPHGIQENAQVRIVPTQSSHTVPGYVPPSGAANATRRRAAGTWRSPT